MAAWAMGRVNSFIRGGHSQDNDIKRGTRGKENDEKAYQKIKTGIPKSI